MYRYTHTLKVCEEYQIKSVTIQTVVTDILRCANGWTTMVVLNDMLIATFFMLHLQMMLLWMRKNLSEYVANISGMIELHWQSTYLETHGHSSALTETIGSSTNQWLQKKGGSYWTRIDIQEWIYKTGKCTDKSKSQKVTYLVD